MADARTRALKLLSVKVKDQPAIARLRKIARTAPERTEKAMGRAVASWHAETVPHLPVRAALGRGQYARTGRGQLKKRTQPFVRRAGGKIAGGLAMLVDYAVWLAAGTRKIAGGRVMRWREGQRPITDWPAKREGGNPRATLPIALPYRANAVKRFNAAALKEIIK